MQTETERRWVLRLDEIRRERGLSDDAFAELMGVHRTHWRRTRNNLLPFGMAVLRGGCIVAPEMADNLADIFLAGKVPDDTERCELAPAPTT